MICKYNSILPGLVLAMLILLPSTGCYGDIRSPNEDIVTLLTFLSAGENTLPVSGAAIWLRSDLGVNTDGSGNVSSWSDQSGNGRNATPVTGQPTFVNNQLNGYPAIHLNGSTFMHTPSITLGKYVMAIVVRVNSGSANHILLEHGNNADAGDGSYLSASNTCSILVQRGGVISGKALSANWAADDQFRLIAHVYNNSHNNNTLVVNGMAQGGASNCTANADPGSANLSAALNIGGRAATSAAITGDIVEIFVYDREITADEGKALFTYAGNRYNIPVSFNF